MEGEAGRGECGFPAKARGGAHVSRGDSARPARAWREFPLFFCEAGAHTAQEQGQGETKGRQCNSVSGAEWHDGARAVLAFLTPLTPRHTESRDARTWRSSCATAARPTTTRRRSWLTRPRQASRVAYTFGATRSRRSVPLQITSPARRTLATSRLALPPPAPPVSHELRIL